MIPNLTQHLATKEQIEDGVVDFLPEGRKLLCELLTFATPPSRIEIATRCESIVRLLRMNADCEDFDFVMIGGAPYLMGPLQSLLEAEGWEVCFSFTERVSVEEVLPDGRTTKTSSFRHCGWVYPPNSDWAQVGVKS
jgi:hypothetical protein